jgi:hypothetical protein
VNGHDVVVGEGVDEILVDESAGRDDAGDTAIVHQTTGFDLAGGIIWELFSNGDIAVQILNQDLEKTVQLKEGETGLARG